MGRREETEGRKEEGGEGNREEKGKRDRVTDMFLPSRQYMWSWSDL